MSRGPIDDVSSRPKASARVEGPFVFVYCGIAATCLFRLWQFFRALPIRDPFQYDYEEGNILNAISRILHGATPYPDPHALPNIINPYGPVAYYLLAIPAKLFGLTFFFPRALILLCTIFIAALIAYELRRITRSTALAIAFAVVFLALPNVQNWAWLLRVDLLGVLFTAAGLVVFTIQTESNVIPSDDARENQPAHFSPAGPRIRVEDPAFSSVVPAIFFAAALLVKPTFIAAPAACFVSSLFNQKSEIKNQKWAVLTAVFVAIVLGIFALFTHGAIITDVFLSHPDPYEFRSYTQWMTQSIVSAWPLVILAAVTIARSVAARRPSPAALWIVFASLTAATSGKLGSNSNHLLEWNTALCLCSGLGFAGLVYSNGPVSRVSPMLIAAYPRNLRARPEILATLCVFIALFTWPAPLSHVTRQPGCLAAYDWVRTQSGSNVLSENVGAVVLADKTIWVSNPFVLAQLVEHAGWSDAALVQMVRNRRFDVILTDMNYPAIPALAATGTYRFSPAFLRALDEKYDAHPAFTCKDMNILFTPKP